MPKRLISLISVVGELNLDKLKTASVDLSKLRDKVDGYIRKNQEKITRIFFFDKSYEKIFDRIYYRYLIMLRRNI